LNFWSPSGVLRDMQLSYTVRIEDYDGELVDDDLLPDDAQDLAQRTANERGTNVVFFNAVECIEVSPQ
jgi:hypothetical protein